MNKLIIVFVFLLSIFFVKSENTVNIGSGSSNEPTDVTLIVNSNKNNVYPVNGLCGTNSSFTFVQVPFTGTAQMYQGLYLLLADGSYSIASSSVNFYQFNVTISTLTPDSNKVIINGTITTPTSTALFTVSPASGVVEASQTSYLYFTGLNFNGFSQTILSVSTQISFTNIVFTSCTFSNFNSKGYSMVDINYNNSKLVLPNSNLIFSESVLNNIISDSPIISTTNSIISFTSTVIENGTFENFLNTTFGDNINIKNSTFNNLKTSTGISTSFDNAISIIESNFNNNTANNGPAVLSFVADASTNRNYFEISFSIFNDNNGINGSIVNGLNTNSSFLFSNSYIGDSQFNGGLAENGGVIYLNNLPFKIVNTIFNNNIASVAGGSIYYLSTNIAKTISLNNVTFTQSNIPNGQEVGLLTASSSSDASVKGNVVYISGSELTIDQSKFDSTYTETIYCLSSTILIDAETEFDSASLSCAALCNASIDATTVCGTTVTSATSATSSTSSSSTTGTGTSTTAAGSSTTGGAVLSITSSSHTSTTSKITGDSVKSNNPPFVLIGLILILSIINFI